jgi:hypothetical protein
MPRARRALGKRQRTWKDERAAGPPPKPHELVWRMEVPLAEAMDLVEALRLMGDGLVERDCGDGSAVLCVVAAAQERLRRVTEEWEGLIQAKRRGT